jgi:hypothetical protein
MSNKNLDTGTEQGQDPVVTRWDELRVKGQETNEEPTLEQQSETGERQDEDGQAERAELALTELTAFERDGSHSSKSELYKKTAYGLAFHLEGANGFPPDRRDCTAEHYVEIYKLISEAKVKSDARAREWARKSFGDTEFNSDTTAQEQQRPEAEKENWREGVALAKKVLEETLSDNPQTSEKKFLDTAVTRLSLYFLGSEGFPSDKKDLAPEHYVKFYEMISEAEKPRVETEQQSKAELEAAGPEAMMEHIKNLEAELRRTRENIEGMVEKQQGTAAKLRKIMELAGQ